MRFPESLCSESPNNLHLIAVRVSRGAKYLPVFMGADCSNLEALKYISEDFIWRLEV